MTAKPSCARTWSNNVGVMPALSGGRAIGRYMGLVVSIWVVYIGVIWAAFDQRKQGWHDKMASTFAVRSAPSNT